jgi:hypothetical protein
LLDDHIRNVQVRYVEADEIWTYVGKKNRHVNDDDPAEFGDQWVFVAMDAERDECTARDSCNGGWNYACNLAFG